MLARLQAWFATSALTLALGAAGGAALAIGWEHHAPFGWGLADKLDASRKAEALAVGDLKTCREDQAATVAETWKWSAAYDRLASARSKDAEEAAASLAAAAGRSARQCETAFSAGVTAGRALRGDTHATDPNDHAGGPGPGVAGGVRDDFRAAWESGAVRAGPDGR